MQRSLPLAGFTDAQRVARGSQRLNLCARLGQLVRLALQGDTAIQATSPHGSAPEQLAMAAGPMPAAFNSREGLMPAAGGGERALTRNRSGSNLPPGPRFEPGVKN
jgi:hypothetical protein